MGLAERPGKGLPSDQVVRAIDRELNANGVLVDLRKRAKAEQETATPPTRP